MFLECPQITNLTPLTNIMLQSTTAINFTSMFRNAAGITDVSPIAGWTLASGANISAMFSENAVIPKTNNIPNAFSFSGTAWPQTGDYFNY
jgi:hypothetical protein